jgi:hypothetical protein
MLEDILVRKRILQKQRPENDWLAAVARQ